MPAKHAPQKARSMKRLFLILICCFIMSASSAQQKVIRGQVTAYEEIPLVGAEILVKSSKKTFKSDSLGNFRVECENKDKIAVLAHGFTEREIKIKRNTKYVLVNLQLKQGEKNRELALGYVKMNDKDKLFAVKALDDSELDYSRYQNIYEALTGNFPGLQIQNGEVVIRNSATFTGSNAALLIVDGREVTASFFANIATSEISNITVLKDASASMYGSRGGNGVVVVETKRGEK